MVIQADKALAAAAPGVAIPPQALQFGLAFVGAATMLRIWLAGGSAQSKTEPLFELVQ